MTNQVNAESRCVLVGDYVDEGDGPANTPAQSGEVVRPRIVGDFLDVGGTNDLPREFTVLMKDGRILSIHGHGLKREVHPQGQDVYGIVARTCGEEVLIALFKSEDVTGIFCGEVRAERRTA